MMDLLVSDKVMLEARRGLPMAEAKSQFLELMKENDVIVVSGKTGCGKTTQLCPLYPHNPEVLLNDLKSPSDLLDYGDFSDCMDGGTGNSRLHVVNPAFDYVPPQLVSLFITDTGGHNPSYMYRLIADYYTPDDFALQEPLEIR